MKNRLMSAIARRKAAIVLSLTGLAATVMTGCAIVPLPVDGPVHARASVGYVHSAPAPVVYVRPAFPRVVTHVDFSRRNDYARQPQRRNDRTRQPQRRDDRTRQSQQRQDLVRGPAPRRDVTPVRQKPQPGSDANRSRSGSQQRDRRMPDLAEHNRP